MQIQTLLSTAPAAALSSKLMMAEHRDAYVDTARGVTCTFLVLYHSVGWSRTSGLGLDDGSFWRLLVEALIYIRMPVFAFLSGYVYGMRPFVGDGKRFLLGKTRRLLLPMFFAGTAFVLLQSIVPGTNGKPPSDWYNYLLFFPVVQYWFLESLFTIFMAIMVLETLGLLSNRLVFSIVLATAIAIQLIIPFPRVFSLQGTVYLFPYFLCGLACVRFRIESDNIFFSALAVFGGAMCYAVAGVLGYAPLSARMSIVALLIGTSAPFLLLRLQWHNQFFAFIGRSSYAIFLYFVFFTGAARILLYSLNFHDVNTLVVIVTTSGIFGPLLVEWIAKRFAITRTVLLGEHWMPSAIDKSLG